MLRRFSLLWAVLFAVSFGVNIAMHGIAPVDLTTEAAHISMALQNGEGFANPFGALASGPTAHVAPVYPFLHAAVCRIFGTGIAGGVAILALTTLIWALHCALVQRFAALHSYPEAGAAAAFLLAALPLPQALFRWDAVFVAATIVGCACVFSMALVRPRVTQGILLGGLMALGTLLNPATAVIWVAWGCVLIYRRGIRCSMQVLAPAAMVFLIPVGAWTARNYSLFGHMMFVRDNLGLELAVSYNECAAALMSANLASGCYPRFHPNENPEMIREVSAMGEYSFNAMRQAQAVTWMRAHPARSLRLSVSHLLLFWFPIDASKKTLLVNGLVISVFTVLSFLGVSWRKSDGFRIAATGFVLFSLVYSLFQSIQRYRYPVLWISVLLAMIGLKRLHARRAGSVR